ncbi:SH2 domain-containing protein 7-like isoform X1 [Conger conger]|uniref:SH2 domain-containing protein 7-like isoform X1 n=1 Tax=Conger conger TaxID=82655 RepID=UPI002A59EB30|nr:SH2 domain-containing protein 7-like isoform X1 [Conger conger]
MSPCLYYTKLFFAPPQNTLTSEAAVIHEETSSYFNLDKMRLRSNRIRQCLTAGTWWHSWPCLRPLNSSLQSRYLAGESSMDQKRKRAPTFQTRLRFRRMDRARMEQKHPVVEPQVELAEGRLEDLALRWFTETQAPLILHQGNFPAWFQGFIRRKDAEAKLADKALGCFLIRLSDKAIGYILSYRGRDRCRHFVINQNKAGHFIISGDIETHQNLTDLIEHYRASPIEPFGEFLTSSYSQSSSSEIYDEVQGKRKERLVSVEAVRSLWQQRAVHSEERPPALPPKRYNRKSTSPASLDLDSPSQQAAPPVPLRTPFQLNARGGSLDETGTSQGQVLYAQLQKRRANQRAPAPTKENADPDGPGPLPGPLATARTPGSSSRASPAPGIVYSELSLENCRSRSLPLLDYDSGESRSFRLSAPSFTPPQLSPDARSKGTGPACSLWDQELGFGPSSGSKDGLCGNPLYQLAGMPWDTQAGRAQALPSTPAPCHEYAEVPFERLQDEDEYAEVPFQPLPCRSSPFSDNTYEMIPDEAFDSSPFQDNTYELIPEQGIKSDKWRRFFAEHKKK